MSSVSVNRFERFSTPGVGAGRDEPVYVGENGFDKEQFMIPKHYSEFINRVLLPRGVVLDRIEKLATDIVEFYGDEEINVICILKGSRTFFSHLTYFLHKLSMYGSPRNGPPYMEHYVRIKSYRNTESTGEVNVITEDLSCLKDKHVLIVEDIVDTGRTMTTFCNWLNKNCKPRDIAIATLLEERTPKSNGFKGDFVGFSVPMIHFVGFSFDYNERFRDLEHICTLRPEAIKKFSVTAATATEEEKK